MKIAFYINNLSSGGAERVISNMANELSNSNEILVITSFVGAKEYILNKKVKRINIDAHEKKENIFFRNIRRTIGLRRILKNYKPDTLVSFMAEPNFRSIIASFRMSHRTIISVRNDPNQEYPNFIFRFLAKTLYRFADHIVFQTENAQKWFSTTIQKKSSIILNPVDEIFYKTTFYGLRHDVITTGRLVPQKNHRLLINAFARIADKIEDNLYIYGEGELRSELEKIISNLNLKDRVFLPGVINNVAETIKSARLFVLCSDYEGLPNSLMEAMALKIPCISTDCPCGGPCMLLNKNFLVGVNDIDDLSEKILKENDAVYFKNNYRINPENFRSKAVVKKWLEVIQ